VFFFSKIHLKTNFYYEIMRTKRVLVTGVSGYTLQETVELFDPFSTLRNLGEGVELCYEDNGANGSLMEYSLVVRLGTELERHLTDTSLVRALQEKVPVVLMSPTNFEPALGGLGIRTGHFHYISTREDPEEVIVTLKGLLGIV
jgi:hypothetical protein